MLHQENRAGKMPTSKRKMDREQWKQRKIVDKLHNDRLGFNPNRFINPLFQSGFNELTSVKTML